MGLPRDEMLARMSSMELTTWLALFELKGTEEPKARREDEPPETFEAD